MLIYIDGEPVDPAEATISVLDLGLVRGIGVFEATKSYGGVPFCLTEHLDRLERSAAANGTPLADRADLEAWSHTAARAADGDAILRLLATPGGADPTLAPPRTIILVEPVPAMPETLRLGVLPAPWHPAGAAWGLSGAKTLSYGPNMHATATAKAAGFDDALLVDRDGIVLEGPTSSVGWAKDGVFRFPTLDLGVLASVTRRVAEALLAEAGVPVETGRYRLEELLEADEVVEFSTVKEVTPVVAVGDSGFSGGPITGDLARRFVERVAEATRRVTA